MFHTVPFALISVFTDFEGGIRGNISSVVLLEEPLSDERMQEMASDFNQPATTFLIEESGQFYRTRWFAPDAEIGLCGHGTMAATTYLIGSVPDQSISMKSPEATVRGYTDGAGHCFIALDPIPVMDEIEIPEVVREGLGIPLRAMYKTDNKYLLRAESATDILRMEPDFATLRKSDIFGYAVTAEGGDVDFVSRTLVPHVSQLEDHATGSSHAVLTPYWADQLDKAELTALQLSPRGGRLHCALQEDEVHLSGMYETLAEGKLKI